jgi:hypothetical protein
MHLPGLDWKEQPGAGALGGWMGQGSTCSDEIMAGMDLLVFYVETLPTLTSVFASLPCECPTLVSNGVPHVHRALLVARPQLLPGTSW